MCGQTRLVDEHIPVAFSMVVFLDLSNFQPKRVNYLGPDAQKVFVREVNKVRDAFYERFKNTRKMIFTKEDETFHNSQERCYGCREGFTFGHNKGHKVRDHCHLTGKYRGTLLNVCNLKRDQKWQIPVIGNNAAGYDSHLFVRDLCGEEGEPTDIEVIPENEQKYTSFSTKRYVEVDKGNGETFTRTIFLNFIDLCKHLQASLHILMKSLPEEEHYQMKRNFDATTVTLLNRKGVYPYEHLDRFGGDQLPPIGKFNSYLGCGGVYEEGGKG